ncbi:peptidylprolyl isomerase [Alkalimonas amylolytica]|nr:peptidylprolyl isomerase [Alkalimonas amylolytica]
MIQVNQTQISEQAILAEMQYHPAESQRDAMLKAAESLVIAELLRQRAKQLGLDVAANQSSTSEHDYLEQLIEREVSIPTASQQECEHYYQQNPQRFTSSPLMEVRHILLAAPPDSDQERVHAKALAEELLLQLQQGQSFAELATKFSACPSNQTGGSLGQISKGQTVPEFERQLFAAEAGLLPAPLESRYGFHVVYIQQKIAGQQLPFAAVQQKIADYLNEKVRRKAIAQYIHTLVVQATIEGYDFNLSESPLMQ